MTLPVHAPAETETAARPSEDVPDLEQNAASPQSEIILNTNTTEHPDDAEDFHQDPNNDNDDDIDNDDVDDDDVTVIILDEAAVSHNNSNSMAAHRTREEALAWIDASQDPAMEERRRGVLMRELKRVQRASFWQFMMLCTIPTILLIVVVGTVVGDEQDCASETTHCVLEPRTFLNAFTTRCICDALQVEGDISGIPDITSDGESP